MNMSDSDLDCSGVYLIHFDQPFKHARHYLGWAKNIQSRIEEHRKGTGARLLAVLKENGIGWQLVRVWKGASRSVESKMKKCHDRTLLCPICGSERKEVRRLSQKTRRHLHGS